MLSFQYFASIRRRKILKFLKTLKYMYRDIMNKIAQGC